MNLSKQTCIDKTLRTNIMSYKTYWLAAILAPMLVPAQAVESKMAQSSTHTVFIDNESVFAMGQNNYLQTDPNLASRTVTVPKFTGISKIKSVAASRNRSAALTTNGSLIMWGLGAAKQITLSVNATDMALTASDIYYIVNGEVFRWNYVPTSAPVKLTLAANGKIKSISAGDTHVLALYEDGSVGSIGLNLNGQLGDGTKNPLIAFTKITKGAKALEILAVSNSSYIRTSAATYAFGKNSSGQLGLNDLIDRTTPTAIPITGTIKKMTGNFASAVFLMGDGSVKATGFHNYVGGAAYLSSKGFIPLEGMSGILDVFAGGQQVFISYGATGVIRGWGGNGYNQLGDNTMTERHNPTYAYFTPVTPVAPPTQTMMATASAAPATKTVTYTSMNDCIKALGVAAGGQICKTLIVNPHNRGNG